MNIAHWLRQEITVAPMTGVNIHGEPQYGPQRKIKARVEASLRKVVNSDGQEVLSDHQIFVLEPIGLQDRIWLPGTDPADVTQARRPLAVRGAVDKSGRTAFWVVDL